MNLHISERKAVLICLNFVETAFCEENLSRFTSTYAYLIVLHLLIQSGLI